MKFLSLLVIIFSISAAHSQMSEAEVSDMCMNQIVAGMVQDKILGDESGICIKFNKDPNGNITGIDFKMNTSAFALGKDNLSDDEQKKKIQTIKDFVVNYQRIATKNNKLTINDIDVQVQSYADGVGGPTTFDNQIETMKTWGELQKYISDDKAGVKYLSQLSPQSKDPMAAVNFKSLPKSAQSILRNIVLGKRRSMTICKEFGIKNCEQRKNPGFSSPELEKRATGRECADRRVSVIKVNLDKAVDINRSHMGDFHPQFNIPHGKEGEELKADMQTAATFDMARRHLASREKYKDAALREKLKQDALEKVRKANTPSAKAAANKLYQAFENYSNGEFSILDLPEEALYSPDLSFYANQLPALNTKYKKFKTDISSSFPDLKPFVDAGDFIGFKEAAEKLTNHAQKKKLIVLQSQLTNYGENNPATDIFNFLSTSDALQYQFIKNPNSPSLTNAASVLGQSNGKLTITLANEDLDGVRRPKNSPYAPDNKNLDDGKAHWQCYGGCGSGIHEKDNGEIMTDFRAGIKDKTAGEMAQEFGRMPTGFGALKSLNVYVIKDCSNCDCLKQRDVRLDDILTGPNTSRYSMDKVTKSPNGKRSISKSAGQIEDPYSTCIFTPPVAHTCKVDPKGSNSGHPKESPKTNYGCAMWDKTSHGLRWTTNFIKEGLELAENSDAITCEKKSMSLSEVAKTARCTNGEPESIPKSCQ